ncbi:MAG: TolC family protein [Gemmatimonas sp.]
MAASSRAKSALFIALSALFAAPAWSMGFAEALASARQNDAQYRAAGHELDAVRMNLPIARSALLPTVTLSAQAQDVEGWRKSRNQQNQEMRLRLAYGAPSSALQLRLPLLNREASVRVDQAEVRIAAGEAQYESRGLDLVERLALAYFEVLLQQENLALSEQQVLTLVQQLEQFRARLARGEGTRVDVARAESDLDLFRVRVIETRTALQLAQRDLARITGAPVTGLRRLAEPFVPPALVPDNLFAWLDLAVRNSPLIRQVQGNLQIAALDVKRNRAAHLPQVNLVGSLSHQQNESVSNLGTTTTQRSLGVQLSVPIYSGGGIDASVKQALSEQAKAEEDLRAQREVIELEVQRQFQSVTDGAVRIRALEQAVQSADLAATGANRALVAGLGTATEASEALTRAFSARRDLAQARIQYLLSRAVLMIRAGQPLTEVASEVDRALVLAAAPRTEPAARP